MKSFSIIIPAYNSESYLKVAISSIINQDYPKEKIQVIIVNDGSSDRTPIIAKEYADKYNFIEFYNKENGNWGSVINYVKENKLVKNDLVVILDSDDKFKPNAFEVINNLCEKGKEQDLYISSFKRWNGSKEKKKMVPFFFLLKRNLTEKTQMLTPLCAPIIYFFKNEVFYKTKKLKEKIAYQDSNFFSQIIMNSNGLKFTKKVTSLYYFNREGNSMSQPWDKKRLDAELISIFSAIEEDAQEIAAFRLCQKKLRESILKYDKNFKITINRKFKFNFFPFYIKWIFWIIYFFQLKSFFIIKKY
ncbi:MAG: glycosyltransferase family 2 protein [Metamycoplasmataceae bacterium]